MNKFDLKNKKPLKLKILHVTSDLSGKYIPYLKLSKLEFFLLNINLPLICSLLH